MVFRGKTPGIGNRDVGRCLVKRGSNDVIEPFRNVNSGLSCYQSYLMLLFKSFVSVEFLDGVGYLIAYDTNRSGQRLFEGRHYLGIGR